MYKRRHYYVPGPSTAPSRSKSGGVGPATALYRKRFAYTELKDMNNDWLAAGEDDDLEPLIT